MKDQTSIGDITADYLLMRDMLRPERPKMIKEPLGTQGGITLTRVNYDGRSWLECKCAVRL